MTLRFGVLHLPQRSLPDVVEDVKATEGYGFDSAWVADHMGDPYKDDTTWFESTTLLAALFSATETLRLGPLVGSMTLRNPSVLALQAMTLDHISNGRLELGIGAAGSQFDHRVTGIPKWEPKERLARFEEFVHIISNLLDGSRVEHDGAHYKVDGFKLTQGFVQQPRPPLTVAALGKNSIRIAARYADSWSSYGFVGGRSLRAGQRAEGDEEIQVARQRNRLVDETCERYGRDPNAVIRSYLTMLGYVDQMPTPEAFADRVGELVGAGMNEFILYWPPDPAQRNALEEIARALPELRTISR